MGLNSLALIFKAIGTSQWTSHIVHGLKQINGIFRLSRCFPVLEFGYNRSMGTISAPDIKKIMGCFEYNSSLHLIEGFQKRMRLSKQKSSKNSPATSKTPLQHSLGAHHHAYEKNKYLSLPCPLRKQNKNPRHGLNLCNIRMKVHLARLDERRPRHNLGDTV
jgi:hypothetical protein